MPRPKRFRTLRSSVMPLMSLSFKRPTRLRKSPAASSGYAPARISRSSSSSTCGSCRSSARRPRSRSPYARGFDLAVGELRAAENRRRHHLVRVADEGLTLLARTLHGQLHAVEDRHVGKRRVLFVRQFFLDASDSSRDSRSGWRSASAAGVMLRSPKNCRISPGTSAREKAPQRGLGQARNGSVGCGQDLGS